MAQGEVKKAKRTAPKNTSRKQNGTRIVKPKKQAAIKEQQSKKKYSAGTAEVTEKMLAGKAGHLEMLRGGKKDSKAENAGAKSLRKKGT